MSYLLLLLVSLLLWPPDTQRLMHGWGQRSKVNVLWHSGLFPLRQSGVLSSNALDDLLDLWNQRINLPEFQIPTLVTEVILYGKTGLYFIQSDTLVCDNQLKILFRKYTKSINLYIIWFWKEIKYSKNSNIVKYYYNLKELFSFLIYFKIVFISVMIKLMFQQHYSSLQCHMILQNRSNMLIWCSINIFLLSIFKIVMLLNILCFETQNSKILVATFWDSCFFSSQDNLSKSALHSFSLLLRRSIWEISFVTFLSYGLHVWTGFVFM